MTNEELEALVNRIADESGMGGLDVGTLYGDFALDVAKAVREECARERGHAGAEAGHTMIADDDVYWLMTWGQQSPDKPPTEMMFEDAKALARLLAEGVIFLNSHWWEKDWPERAQKTTALCVNCNDIFAWGCADAEQLEHNEIQGLYDLWRADRTWGAAKWCAIKRMQQPQPPVIAAMKKAGAWDVCMEALGANTQDAEVQAMFAALRAPNVKVTGAPPTDANKGENA